MFDHQSMYKQVKQCTGTLWRQKQCYDLNLSIHYMETLPIWGSSKGRHSQSLKLDWFSWLNWSSLMALSWLERKTLTWKKEIDAVNWDYVLGYSFSWNLALLPHPQLFALQHGLCYCRSTGLCKGKTSANDARLEEPCHLCIHLPYLYFIWQSNEDQHFHALSQLFPD